MAKRKSKSKYMKYKQAYYERARQFERKSMERALTIRKKELIKERDQIKAGRKLTKAEREYYKREIADATLTKARRRDIERAVKSINQKELGKDILRDRIMNKKEFEAFYNDMKEAVRTEQLERARKRLGDDYSAQDIQEPSDKEIIDNITYQQAYAYSRKQYRSIKRIVTDYIDEHEAEDDENDYYDVGFDIGDYIQTDEIEDLNEFDFITGEQKLENYIDFDKVHELYNTLKAEGWEPKEAKAYISNNIFGSK